MQPNKSSSPSPLPSPPQGGDGGISSNSSAVTATKSLQQQEHALFWDTHESHFYMSRFLFQLAVQTCPYIFLLTGKIKGASHGYFIPECNFASIFIFLFTNFPNFAAYTVILSYSMMSTYQFNGRSDVTENEVHGYVAFLGLIMWFLHRAMSALRYATMSPSEYKKVQNVRNKEDYYEMAARTQLLSAWLNRSDKDSLMSEAASGAIGAGVNAAHTYFIIENPDSNSSEKIQFENWKNFLLVGHDVSSMQLQPDGSYRISLLDVCVAVLSYSSSKDHGMRYVNFASNFVTIALSVLPLLVLSYNGTGTIWTVLCYVCGTYLSFIFTRVVLLFLSVALIDAIRRCAEIEAIAKMMRISDVFNSSEQKFDNLRHVDIVNVFTGLNYVNYESICSLQSSVRSNYGEKEYSDIETTEGVADLKSEEADNENADPWSRVGDVDVQVEMVDAKSDSIKEAADAISKKKDSSSGDVPDVISPSLNDLTSVSVKSSLRRDSVSKLYHESTERADIPRLNTDIHGSINIHAWNYLRLMLLYVGERFVHRLSYFIIFIIATVIFMMVAILSLLLRDLSSTLEFRYNTGTYALILQFSVMVIFFVALIMITAFYSSEVNVANNKHRQVMQNISMYFNYKLILLEKCDNPTVMINTQRTIDAVQSCDASILLFGRMRPYYFCGFEASPRVVSIMGSFFTSFMSSILGIYFTAEKARASAAPPATSG